MTKQTNPVYGNWYNGIGISKKVQNAFDDMTNCDVNTETGSLMCQKALEQKDGGLVNRPCYRAVVPNGDTYFFSQTDGHIFKRTQTGIYSSVRTGTNGAFKGAAYYNGYLFYSMDAFLGRFDLNATWNDNYQVLTAGYPHPIYQFDLIMYVGDKNNVAQLDDAGVWTSSALDLPPEEHVTALIEMGDDLLSLSNPGDYLSKASITRWNTYSPSWTVKNKVSEVNAYAFLSSDNYVYAVCDDGNIYYYDGSNLSLFSNIRNAKSTSGHQLTTNYKGRPLIANGGRIYSLYRKNANLPIALVGEFTCSAGESATIYSIVANGSALLVSWGLNGEYGIDEMTANLSMAKVVTPRFGKYSNVKVYYNDLADGQVTIEHKYDGESSWTAHTVIDDNSDNRVVYLSDYIFPDSGGQARITVIPDGPISPVIDRIEII